MKFIFVFFMLVANSVFAADPNSVSVLAYHRITSDHPLGQTVISKELFAKHLDYLKRENYNTVTISQLVEFMKGNIELPSKSIALTFDDGWKDQLVAAKMLKDSNMSATFYIMSGAFGDAEYMSLDDVLDLGKNKKFDIGAHSHSHFPGYKGTIPLNAMVGELVMSKHILEALLNRKIHHYAWPYGYSTEASIDYAGWVGYDSAAMINSTSVNKKDGTPMNIERINIDGNCTVDHLKKMLDTGKFLECK